MITKIIKKIQPVLICSAILTAGLTTVASAGPAFNCRYAKLPVEVAICDSAELSELDRALSTKYSKVRITYRDTSAYRTIKREQKSWIRYRNRCGYNTNCISARYISRLRVLAQYGEIYDANENDG